MGWHPYPAPLAILSQPCQGRACAHCGFCESFGGEWGAKSSTLASVIPMAEKTGRCEIRPNSYVSKISTNKNGRVDGVRYGSCMKVYAFAEEGKAAQVPGPLIRVPERTETPASWRCHGYGGS